MQTSNYRLLASRLPLEVQVVNVVRNGHHVSKRIVIHLPLLHEENLGQCAYQKNRIKHQEIPVRNQRLLPFRNNNKNIQRKLSKSGKADGGTKEGLQKWEWMGHLLFLLSPEKFSS